MEGAWTVSFTTFAASLISKFHNFLVCQLGVFDLEKSLQNCFTHDCADKKCTHTFILLIGGKLHMDTSCLVLVTTSGIVSLGLHDGPDQNL